METKNNINASPELIQKIVDLEWEMFSTVSNEGGKASCQSRPATFEIMRKSQILTWSVEIMESYLKDLTRAKAAGRNLCTEKYAYMMESTDPGQFEKLRPFLPPVEDEKQHLIQEIVAVNLDWERSVDQKYEKVRSRGRPLTKEHDTPFFTSVETSMTGELESYSLNTVRLLHAYTLLCKEEGRNLANENLANIVAAYGFDSVSDVEELL